MAWDWGLAIGCWCCGVGQPSPVSAGEPSSSCAWATWHAVAVAVGAIEASALKLGSPRRSLFLRTLQLFWGEAFGQDVEGGAQLRVLRRSHGDPDIRLRQIFGDAFALGQHDAKVVLRMRNALLCSPLVPLGGFLCWGEHLRLGPAWPRG